jgi:hypothetical protein
MEPPAGQLRETSAPAPLTELTKLTWFSLPPMRYTLSHLAFVLVSSLDVILTWIVLEKGGKELNPIAALVIDDWGLNGAIAFKFSLVLFVIIVAEVVGRAQHGTGRGLAVVAVIISAMPVVYTTAALSLAAR